MTTQKLIDLGFREIPGIFSEKCVWVWGEEDTEICGNPIKLPIVYYEIETQTCKVVRGEFCVIVRECKNEEEIMKFVESICFLFNMKYEKF